VGTLCNIDGSLCHNIQNKKGTMTSQACRFPISANILCIATVFAPDNNFIGAALDANRADRHAKVEYGCSGNLSTGKPSATEAAFKIAYRF
jgi:hypothetical protein